MSDAETVLQPSLHSTEEYAQMLLDEASVRGIDVGDLQESLDKAATFDEYETISEVMDEVRDRLWAKDYANAEDTDTFIIMPKGEELPEEWRDD